MVALAGPLGAGKTVFVKGLAEGFEIDSAGVASPTFVIASEYESGARRLAHVDLYRLESAAELEAAGFLDLLRPGALVAVEWADRFADALPRERLDVVIGRPDARAQPEHRTLAATAQGKAAAAALEGWRKWLAEAGAFELE